MHFEKFEDHDTPDGMESGENASFSHVATADASEAIALNVHLRREKEKNQLVLIYEIPASNTMHGEYKEMTLRTLLHNVHMEVDEIEQAFRESMKNVDESRNGDGSPFVDTDIVTPHAVPVDDLHKRTSSGARPVSISGLSHARSTSDLANVGRERASTRSAASARQGMDQVNSAVLPLRLRDLRRLDFSINNNEEMTVQVRRHCVLFSVDPVRAVLTAKTLRLIVPPGADTLMSILPEYMKEWMVDEYTQSMKSETDGLDPDGAKSPGKDFNSILPSSQAVNGSGNGNSPTYSSSVLPFEIHAYESLLSTVKDMMTVDFNQISEKVNLVLGYFKRGAMISLPVQELMRQQKDLVTRFSSKISNYRRSLEDIIEEDEGMALMSLTVLKNKPSLYAYPLCPEILVQHEEIEESLESYLIDFTSLETSLTLLRSHIQSAEEHVSLRLDISRNENLIANTALAVLSCSIAFGAYITGIFGMNLDQTIYLQPKKGSFVGVTVASFAVIVVIFVVVYGYFRHTGVIPRRTGFSTASQRLGRK